MNLLRNEQQPTLFVAIEGFVGAFEEGSQAFVAELNQDQTRFAIAEERACRFVGWETSK